MAFKLNTHLSYCTAFQSILPCKIHPLVALVFLILLVLCGLLEN